MSKYSSIWAHSYALVIFLPYWFRTRFQTLASNGILNSETKLCTHHHICTPPHSDTHHILHVWEEGSTGWKRAQNAKTNLRTLFAGHLVFPHFKNKSGSFFRVHFFRAWKKKCETSQNAQTCAKNLDVVRVVIQFFVWKRERLSPKIPVKALSAVHFDWAQFVTQRMKIRTNTSVHI